MAFCMVHLIHKHILQADLVVFLACVLNLQVVSINVTIVRIADVGSARVLVDFGPPVIQAESLIDRSRREGTNGL